MNEIIRLLFLYESDLHAELNEDFPLTFLEIWMKLDLDNLDLCISASSAQVRFIV